MRCRCPRLLTQVEATVASATDLAALPLNQADLARSDRQPAEELVDAGYTPGGNLVASNRDYQVDLVGPVYGGRHWQAKAGAGFDVGHFQIDWEVRYATSPQGHQSVRWREMQTARERQRTVAYVATYAVRAGIEDTA